MLIVIVKVGALHRVSIEGKSPYKEKMFGNEFSDIDACVGFLKIRFIS